MKQIALISCVLITVQGYKLNQNLSALDKVGSHLKHGEEDYLQGAFQSLMDTDGELESVTSLRRGGSSSGKSGSTTGKIGAFGAGCLLIGLALPMVWFNEKNQVKIYALIKKGRQHAISDDNYEKELCSKNFKLVHASDLTSTQDTLVDKQFGLQVMDSIKLKRVVEMFQWVEEKEEDDDKNVTYTYTQEWKSQDLDSSSYSNQMHSNPNSKPAKNTKFDQAVTLGSYLLDKSQVDQLPLTAEYKISDEERMIVCQTVNGFFSDKGYSALRWDGTHFNTRLVDQDHGDTSPIIGDTRINWLYIPNQQVTVVAQQMQNDEGVYTFRQWNPDKENVPWGENNDSNTDPSCPLQCICCYFIEIAFLTMSMTVMNYCKPGHSTLEQAMDTMDSDNAKTTSAIRWISWIMSVVGHILLFSPIIALFAWIPLVGGLLSGVFFVAILVFAFVWGTMLHFLIMAVSWLVYRPLYGIILLAGVGAGVAILCMGGGQAAAVVAVK